MTTTHRGTEEGAKPKQKTTKREGIANGAKPEKDTGHNGSNSKSSINTKDNKNK
jgi:hypothetical protein